MADKRLKRLKARPRDFTWNELQTLLQRLGYELVSGSGSRRRFVDADRNKIFLHEPHPGNVLKTYQIDEVLKKLEEHGKI